MTAQRLADMMNRVGYKTSVTDSGVCTLINPASSVQFSFDADHYGEHGEGLAAETLAFAKSLNETALYVQCVRDDLGLAPQDINQLSPEHFEGIVQSRRLEAARLRAKEIIRNAWRLADRARELSEGLAILPEPAAMAATQPTAAAESVAILAAS